MLRAGGVEVPPAPPVGVGVNEVPRLLRACASEEVSRLHSEPLEEPDKDRGCRKAEGTSLPKGHVRGPGGVKAAVVLVLVVAAEDDEEDEGPPPASPSQMDSFRSMPTVWGRPAASVVSCSAYTSATTASWEGFDS